MRRRIDWEMVFTYTVGTIGLLAVVVLLTWLGLQAAGDLPPSIYMRG